VVKWDVIDIAGAEKITVVFESISSSSRQGIWLRCDEGIEIDGTVYPQVALWSGTAPAKAELIGHTKKGRLHIYDVWDQGDGRESQPWRSGLKVDALGDGYRYRRTDAGPEVNFDALVFKLARDRK
jgi:hypothetical protein